MIEVRTYSIDELVTLTGFSQRNIAYYIQQGLLPKIGRRGRNTRYPQLFVDRLRFIQRVRDLQDSGRLGSVTLPRIARVIWYLVEQSGEAGDLPDLDDRELQQVFEGDSIPDERVLGQTHDGELVIASFGKFGPEVRAVHGTASIDAEEFNSITLAEALERIDERIREKERQELREFHDEEIQDRKARKSASERRDRLSAHARRREMAERSQVLGLVRSDKDLGEPETESKERKNLLDRLRHRISQSHGLGLGVRPVSTLAPERDTPEVETEDVEAVDSLEDTFSCETAVNLDQSDPVAEADFHMAYGLYDQAADLINGALEAEPYRLDLLAKLCEVYFVWGDRDAFVDTAARVKQLVGDDERSEWDKIVIMAQQIAADDALFADAGIGGVAEAMDLAFDANEDESYDLDLDFAPTAEGDDSEDDFDFMTADDTMEEVIELAGPELDLPLSSESGEFLQVRISGDELTLPAEEIRSASLESDSLRARLMIEELERLLATGPKEKAGVTKYWIRVPISDHIEISVQSSDPTHTKLVEAFAEEIRSLLGIESDACDK
jgi:hypothetical protein